MHLFFVKASWKVPYSKVNNSFVSRLEFFHPFSFLFSRIVGASRKRGSQRSGPHTEGSASGVPCRRLHLLTGVDRSAMPEGPWPSSFLSSDWDLHRDIFQRSYEVS